MSQTRFVKRCFGKLIRMGIFNRMNDKSFLELSYYVNLGKRLDLQNPKTFNEKLQWLKLYDRRDEYITYVDKYEVRKYISSRFGDDILIPIYGVWDSVDEIDFSKLPEQYVIKCTHDSGSVCICNGENDFDVERTKNILRDRMRHSLFYWGREWPYKNVKPRIIVEKYMQNSATENELTDYKLMCFNGTVKCSFTATDRFAGDGLKITFFDRDWNKLPFGRHYPVDNKPIDKPVSYDRMVSIAESISAGYPFMRIDFYEIDEKPYFGEITLYPGNGMEEFNPEEWDRVLGDWIDLEGIERHE